MADPVSDGQVMPTYFIGMLRSTYKDNSAGYEKLRQRGIALDVFRHHHVGRAAREARVPDDYAFLMRTGDDELLYRGHLNIPPSQIEQYVGQFKQELTKEGFTSIEIHLRKDLPSSHPVNPN